MVIDFRLAFLNFFFLGKSKRLGRYEEVKVRYGSEERDPTFLYVFRKLKEYWVTRDGVQCPARSNNASCIYDI